MAKMQRLSATNPLRLVVETATRVASPSPVQSHPARPSPAPSQSQSQPRSTPLGQVCSERIPPSPFNLWSETRIPFYYFELG